MGRRDNHGIAQKRSLSQIFLVAKWPLGRYLQRLNASKVQKVLEIGPGGGILTTELIQAGFQVTAIERDERFAERLQETCQRHVGHSRNLVVLCQDVLKFDLASWLSQAGVKAVVGNIPYNISSPIVQWFIPHMEQMAVAQLMVQLEFAQRLVATPDSKDYGSLTVYTRLRATPELECKVESTCFRPQPKVDSAIVSFVGRPKSHPDALLSKVELVTRSAFMQRRKTIRNSLRAYLDKVDEGRCPIDLGRRADSIWPEEYIALAEYLMPQQ